MGLLGFCKPCFHTFGLRGEAKFAELVQCVLEFFEVLGAVRDHLCCWWELQVLLRKFCFEVCVLFFKSPLFREGVKGLGLLAFPSAFREFTAACARGCGGKVGPSSGSHWGHSRDFVDFAAHPAGGCVALSVLVLRHGEWDPPRADAPILGASEEDLSTVGEDAPLTKCSSARSRSHDFVAANWVLKQGKLVRIS